MNREKKYIAIASNEDGRPCGWAAGDELHAVKRAAVAAYHSHGGPFVQEGQGPGCYPGELEGFLTVTIAGVRHSREPLEVSVCEGCEEIFLHDGPEGGLSIAPSDELGAKYGDAGRCIPCWQLLDQ